MRSRRPSSVFDEIGLGVLGVLMLLLASGSASASEEDGIAGQHLDIVAQRQAVQRRFEEKQRACQQRFVVTACLDAAQKERREALVPLRQEEIRIDTRQRKQRAAARLEDIEAKQRADAARESAASTAPRSSGGGSRPPPAAGSAPGPGAPPAAGSMPRAAAPIHGGAARAPMSDDERQRREAASLSRFQANQTSAQERREAADARNAKRAASGKVVRPLPAPEGASAP